MVGWGLALLASAIALPSVGPPSHPAAVDNVESRSFTFFLLLLLTAFRASDERQLPVRTLYRGGHFGETALMGTLDATCKVKPHYMIRALPHFFGCTPDAPLHFSPVQTFNYIMGLDAGLFRRVSLAGVLGDRQGAVHGQARV